MCAFTSFNMGSPSFTMLAGVLVLYGFGRKTIAVSLGRPLLLGPSKALVGAVENFQCDVQPHPDVNLLFQLFRRGDRSKVLGHYSSLSGETASIPLVIRHSYEGYLECVVSIQNDTLVAPVVSHSHLLLVLEPVKGAEIKAQSGLLEFYEGDRLVLQCNVSRGNHLSFDWLVDGKPVSTAPPYYHVENQLYIYSSAPGHSGAYVCVASNKLNNTLVFTSKSSPVLVKVKALVSSPEISFSVEKTGEETYSAHVICQSNRGTPPITFSLYNGSELVTAETASEGLNATFQIPLVLDRHLGWLQCQAENRKNTTRYSRWIALNVVPVDGPVTMRNDYDVGENFAVVSLTFYCSAARGTFPRYRWFLNGTVLEDTGSFYWIVHQPPERSILLLSVGGWSAGTYQCDVADSFDNSTAIRSAGSYVDKEVLNHLPTSAVAVVFGCFLFLVTLTTTFCCMGLMYRQGPYGEKSRLDLEMAGMSVRYSFDDKQLGEEDYEEEEDVVRAARFDDSDQGSVVSLEEWICVNQPLRLTILEEKMEEVEEKKEEVEEEERRRMGRKGR